jgi:2-polyprenyl-3-methyl-5-hydroxy-6-metoxy-1,4-benzoquinol methylase
MTSTLLKEKVLEENRRVHALENQLYLSRHPEQTNFFQNYIVERTLDQICLGLDRDAKILDLGCGTGYLFLRFLRRGFDVTGLDLSAEMIEVL